MQLLNQFFYFFFALATLLVMMGARGASQLDKANPNPIYWLIAPSLMSASFILYGLTPYNPDLFITISTVTFIFSNIAANLLFRSWNFRLGKGYQYFFWIGYLSCIFAYEIFRQNSSFNTRVYVVSISLAFLALWSFVEVLKYSISLKQKSTNLIFLKITLLTEFFLSLSRAYTLFQISDKSMTTETLYQEPLESAVVRFLGFGLCLIIYILIGNIFLERLWKKEQIKSSNSEATMLNSLNALALARDNETGNHIIRTQKYVELLANHLIHSENGSTIIDEIQIEALVKAAPLHDLGKVGIPDSILHKPGELSEEEWEIMKTHTSIGEIVLAKSQNQINDAEDEVLRIGIEISGGHHERWDGNGYPRGISGNDIPLSARLMSVADMYDALVSRRTYKEPWTHEKACQEIIRNAGSHFDPMIVQAFIFEQENFRAIANQHPDS